MIYKMYGGVQNIQGLRCGHVSAFQFDNSPLFLYDNKPQIF